MTSNSNFLSSSERSLHQHTTINNLDMPWVKLTWLHCLKFCNNVLLSECLVTTPYVFWLKVTLSSSIWLPSFLRTWCVRRIGGKSCHALLTDFEYCGSRPIRLEEDYETSVRICGRHIPYILESNPHPFYSFRGLKNQMRFRFAVVSWILEK